MNELEIKKILKKNFNIDLNKKNEEIDVTNIIYDPILSLMNKKDIRFNLGGISSEYSKYLKENYPDKFQELLAILGRELDVNPESYFESKIEMVNDYIFNIGIIFNTGQYVIESFDNKFAVIKILSTNNGKVKNYIISLPCRGWDIFYKPIKTYYKEILSFLVNEFGEEKLYFIDILKDKKRYLSEYYYEIRTPKVYPKEDFVKVKDFNKYGSESILLKSDKSIAQDCYTGQYFYKSNMIRLYSKNNIVKYFYSNEELIYFIKNNNYLLYFDNVSDNYRKSFKKYIDCSEHILKVHKDSYGLLESEEVAAENDLLEVKHFGIYIKKTADNSYINELNFCGFLLPYFNNIKLEQDLCYEEKLKYGIESPSSVLTGGKRYTFGVELETSNGNLPYNVMKKYNVKTMRDGSIGGHEFVTGILKGDAGLLHLNHLIYELNNRCQIDKRCGLHVHLGGTVFNRELLVVLYHLGLKIQEEMFELVPENRRQSKYCRYLPIVFSDSKYKKLANEHYNFFISEYYRKIYNEVMLQIKDCPAGIIKDGNTILDSPGLGPKNNKFKVHKDGRWNNGRYYWLNLQPAMFATREGDIIDISKTFNIEFRNHSPSLNYKKIKNWILILMGILSFAENNKRRILFDNSKITLKEILYSEFSEKPIELKSNLISLPSYLNNYVEERKALFASKMQVSSFNGEIVEAIPMEESYKEETTYNKKIKELICV